MPNEYTIGRFRGELCLVFYDEGGRRHRHTLGTASPREAELRAPAVFAELTRPKGSTVRDLWDAYRVAHAGRVIATNMGFRWKALEERFGNLDAESIAKADCLAHAEERAAAGMKPWTIFTELGQLRNVLNWAKREKMIKEVPYIPRPPMPEPKEDHRTREECRALIDGADTPHVKLFIIVALGTGARNGALLGLKWDRCDFTRDLIDLRDTTIKTPHKGRAVVPMNRTVKAALLDAQRGALSDYVIEWGGHRVYSVKKGLTSLGKKLGIPGVHPHIFRHSAAVHMAEGGTTMEEIAQFLGHEDVETTRRVYARFSPNYLRKAAALLEYDDISEARRGSMNQR